VARNEERAQQIGRRIKEAREKKGWSQTKLAKLAGVSQSHLTRLERGVKTPREGTLRKIGTALGFLEIEDLTVGGTLSRRAAMHYESNPKPLRLGEIILDRIFLMIGNSTEPLDFTVGYQHTHLAIPVEVKPLYRTLLSRAQATARVRGFPFYNGPVVRLLRASYERSRQLVSGTEQKGLVLDIGPLSWFDFTVLNTFLDDDLFPSQPDNTLRKRFGHPEKVYHYSPDLRWCQLAPMLAILMIPITLDGYGLLQHRSGRGVSVEGDVLISGVSENMHRYLDEASPDDLLARLNTLQPTSAQPVDHWYRPRGVPSPFLTAQRGLPEELSQLPGLENNPTRFRFLNLVFSFDYFIQCCWA
jgi:transcriptional regulator with XRE-family HTH domain